MYKKIIPINSRVCRECGCTNDDCRQCIAKTGHACYWSEPDLCSACLPEIKKRFSDHNTIEKMVEHQRVKDLWYGTFSQGKPQKFKTEKL